MPSPSVTAAVTAAAYNRAMTSTTLRFSFPAIVD
jgi:hypothetical protein